MDTRTPYRLAHCGDAGASGVEGRAFQVCSRRLTLATLVIALAGFAGTAFSAAPAELFGQPASCVVSH